MDRKPAVAGSFYSANKQELEKEIFGYFKDSNLDTEIISKDIKGIIAPHAGYIYSGKVAAAGYKYISESINDFDTIFIAAPSHRSFFRGISVYNEGNYVTPLGKVEIDKEKTGKLLNQFDFITYFPEAELQEHSLEVQLPFLQCALKSKFKIVPLLFGQVSQEMIIDLCDFLFHQFDLKNSLFIASSDLSHFYKYDQAVKLDKKCINTILEKTSEYFAVKLEKDFSACGGVPIYFLMKMMEIAKINGKFLVDYKNSGDIANDKTSVVGYTSILFYK